ncbi:hypothetical protein IV203_015190 [Nitzschia inconspicua]|uniref:Uncharacterized protein n=1 Tax=Nitzschia inconspicua TaxID=303405 RepID=A0A9K3PT98_9STRA|nr:hypothetical protein IV203_015190 [Nitzschia inconspicua]
MTNNSTETTRTTFHWIQRLLLAFILLRSTIGFLPASRVLKPNQRVGKDSPSSPHHVVTKQVDQTQAQELDVASLKQLDNCKSGIIARRILEKATANSSLYNSVRIPPGASDRVISDGDLAIQTKIRNKKYGIFDLIDLNGDRDADRASAGVLGVFLASSFSAIAAQDNLPGPEIFRFVVVWILSFTPLALVGYGIATPENLQALLVSVQRKLFLTYRKRMIQHEAGHFLMAHLLGYPIQGYSTNAVKNAVEFYPLNDPNTGLDRASQLGFDTQRQSVRVEELNSPPSNPDAPFFSKEGRGAQALETQSVFRNAKKYTDNPFLKLPSQMEPTRSWPFRGFDHGTVDQLAAVSVAGVCAEILAFGNAEGGVADFSQLRQIFASAEPELTERDMDNRIRFSLGFTITQLRLHLGALDALAAVMERGGSVSECVTAIEQCSNVNGNDAIFGDQDYDVRRRQQFRSLGVSLWEKLLLGEKNADTEETRFVEGRGGGYKENKRLIHITGDDPLYIALGIAFIFLAWAVDGGLTL